MTKQTIIVKPNMDGYKDVTDRIGQILLQGKPCTIDITEGERKKRSLSANALLAVWVGEIADWSGKMEKDVRNEIKRDFGLDILLKEGDEQATVLGYSLDKIDYNLMSEEQKLKVMNIIAVTSIMTTKQHNELRDKLQIYYGEQGLVLDIK